MRSRTLFLPLVFATALAGLVAPTSTAAPSADKAGQSARSVRVDVPQVFGHRGASGYRPEHTLASYRLAIQLGADYIEPDLVPTKDGVLVARHENDITGTTDVADRQEFAARETTKTIDGRPITGWFTEDFTLAELKTLRAKERLPDVRPGNTRFDGRFQVPTFAEVLALVKEQGKKYGREIGVAPETKHPTYFDSIGLSPEEPMLRELKRAGLDRTRSKVLIQSFEITNLRQLDTQTDLPLEQLVDATGAPFDAVAAGDPTTTYASMVTRAGLREISQYADWVGPQKDLVLPRNAAGATTVPSSLVPDAHRYGLRVVVFTLRDENQFMAINFRRGTDPNAKGDIFAEVTAFLDAGVDGLFADYPDSAVDARDAWLE
ncbi:MAG: glycerophosphodiester phosphodiesterase [Nocardioides sp.]|nr:glycerophosphodiester phosphodiesterase [Nocardioides sp.]